VAGILQGVGPLRLRSLLRRNRHRVVVLLTFAALASAVLAAHGGTASDHMGHQTDLATPITMCLAVVGTIGVLSAIALFVGGLRPWRWPRPRPAGLPRSHIAPGPSGRRARAGPELLQVFRT
jgi:hypothetical protein